MKSFFVLVISIFGLGCASGNLMLTSSPDKAKVFIKGFTGDFIALGEAPISKTIGEIKNMVGGENAVVIEARMADHLSQSIVVADIDSATDIRVNLTLQSIEKFVAELKQKGDQKTEEEIERDKLIESEKEADRLVKMNKLVDKLFEVQRLVKVGQMPEASKRLEEMQIENPNLAVIYELKGGIAYMSRDFNKALDNYTMAVKYYPYNVEVVNMKRYLEKVLGVDRKALRTPANVDPQGIATDLPPASEGENE